MRAGASTLIRNSRKRDAPSLIPACQESDADERDEAARGPHRDLSHGPARQQPERDAGEMQQSGGDHEPDRIGDRIGARGQFGAVRMAVKDRERADQHRRDP